MSDLPVPLLVTAEVQVHSLREKNRQPTSFEITFGPGALEKLSEDRELLRALTSIKRLVGIEVTYPEEPGLPPQSLSLRLIGGDMHIQTAIPAVVLLDAYREAPE